MGDFECHITVEPVYDNRLKRLKDIAAGYDFRVADLLMRKRLQDTPERSQFDTFLTGRDDDYRTLDDRMVKLVAAATDNGFAVWRLKIEAILLDFRYGRG